MSTLYKRKYVYMPIPKKYKYTRKDGLILCDIYNVCDSSNVGRLAESLDMLLKADTLLILYLIFGSIFFPLVQIGLHGLRETFSNNSLTDVRRLVMAKPNVSYKC